MTDATAALEDAVFDGAVYGIPERGKNERRFVGGRRAFLLDRNAQIGRTFGNPHLAILPGGFGGNKIPVRVIPRDCHLPRAGKPPLITKVL